MLVSGVIDIAMSDVTAATTVPLKHLGSRRLVE
jgi:hypothetical protein